MMKSDELSPSSSSSSETRTSSPSLIRTRSPRSSWKEQQQSDIELLRAHLKKRRVTVPTPLPENEATSPSKQQCEPSLSWIRMLLVDLPLLLLCCTTGITYFSSHVYHSYYIPMFDASLRAADDQQLWNEFTYYERECTVQDITSRHGEGLLLNETTHTATEAVSNIMLHGTSIIPNILDKEVMEDLRQYILNRNNILTRAEKIPLSQNKKRASFAMDATDHESIVRALRQVGTHEYLKSILQQLLGTVDPAVTEITAITAYEGAEDQVWHPDVKPDGNALKFARTYSHSYSLFIPLQDTTADMGATTLCPGTHYCANWIDELCDREGFQATEASPDDHLWHAGHGTLLNQQMWHRGAGHKKGPPRVVFIVSFIAPPDETRQLQRGTYFHMKWNMWGHTFRDLQDSHVSMTKPFSVLRALHLWKPASRNFGYDLISSAIMRIANQQQGMSSYELKQFRKNIVSQVLPEFLQGRVDKKSKFPWKDYLEETMVKVKPFVYGIHVAALILYGVAVGSVCVVQRSIRPAASIRRMVWIHGIAAVLVYYAGMNRVAQSPWGRQVQSGRFLRPPFSNQLQAQQQLAPATTTTTTLPTRFDILVGTRFDAAYLGAYDRWLDYHPGNYEFAQDMEHCSRMPVSLDSSCIDFALSSRGRILLQDWTTGNWVYHASAKAYAHAELRKLRHPLIQLLIKSVDRLVAYNRFDATTNPNQLLYKTWLERLHQLKNQIALPQRTMKEKIVHLSPSLPLTRSSRRLIKSTLLPIPAMDNASVIRSTQVDPLRELPPPHRFQKGDVVWVYYAGREEGAPPEFYRGIVASDDAYDDRFVNVVYDDGDYEEDVAIQWVRHEALLEERAFVSFTPKRGRLTQKALVERVHASGRVNLRVNNHVHSHVDPSTITRMENW